MKLERVRPTAWRVTLHPLELATVMSTLRWVAEAQNPDLPTEARDRVRQLLRDYDSAVAATGAGQEPAADRGHG